MPAGHDDPRGLPRAQGIDTPTLCYLENLTPVNVCRVCVVEVKGSRVLVPACSRKVEAGMEVQTDSERVRTSRKVVLELLGSSVDLSLAGPARRTAIARATASATAPTPPGSGSRRAAARRGERDARDAGHHHAAEGDAPSPRPSPSP